jgi:hypothetical protein
VDSGSTNQLAITHAVAISRPARAKEHLELNAGAGIPQPAPVHLTDSSPSNGQSAAMPSPGDPPGRPR